jgi:hypothetical protein
VQVGVVLTAATGRLARRAAPTCLTSVPVRGDFCGYIFWPQAEILILGPCDGLPWFRWPATVLRRQGVKAT